MTALYELSIEYQHMAQQLADLDLDEQTIADTLEAEGGDLALKMENVTMAIRNMESSAAQIGEAINMMQARQKSLMNRAKHIRGYLLNHMLQTGMTVTCPLFQAKPRKNPASLDIFEPKLIPDNYWVQPPQPPLPPKHIDNAAVKDALKNNVDVPGARLVSGHRLEIK